MDVLSKLLGEWSADFNVYSCIFKFALCMIFAIVMGSERATKLQAAGLKTFVSVSLATSLAALGDMYLTEVEGVSVSFLCPAVILGSAVISSNTILFSSKNQFRGLTTSVGLLCVEMISAVICYGLYFVGILAFVVYMIFVVVLPKLERKIKQKSSYFELHTELKSRDALQIFITTLRQLGLKINGVELNPAYANSGLAVYSVSVKVVAKELKDKTHREIVSALESLEMVNYIEEI